MSDARAERRLGGDMLRQMDRIVIAAGLGEAAHRTMPRSSSTGSVIPTDRSSKYKVRNVNIVTPLRRAGVQQILRRIGAVAAHLNS